MVDQFAIDLPDAQLFYTPNFIQQILATNIFTQLQCSLDWRQSAINLFGKSVLEPRLTSWYADPGVRYAYSGRQLLAQPWPACLQSLRTSLNTLIGHPFNAVLANLYRDGDDYMGWHSDDEASLGIEPIIASISLGAEREFVLRRKDDHLIKHKLPLAHGSLLVMQGVTQKYWQHSLPKRKKVNAARINLTFRNVY